MYEIRKNIYRNKTCFCGSGIKYKKCCIKYDTKDQFYKFADYSFQLNMSNSNKRNLGKCMMPVTNKQECSNTCINAHSISKSVNLKNIQINNEVYSWNTNSFYMLKKENNILKKINIKKASTFYGFCKEHDEFFNFNLDFEFNILEKKHYLYSYFRELSKEILKVEHYLSSFYIFLNFLEINKRKNKLTNEIINFLDKEINIYEEKIQILKKFKRELNYSLLSNEENIFCSYIEVDYLPFNFSLIVDILNNNQILHIAALNNNNKPIIIFTCPNNNKNTINFFRKKLNNEYILDFILRMSFLSENSFYNINWIDNNNIKEKIFNERERQFKDIKKIEEKISFIELKNDINILDFNIL